MATANSASSSRQSSFIFKKSYLYENRFTMGGAFLRICRRRRFPVSVSFEQADYYNLPMSMRNFAHKHCLFLFAIFLCQCLFVRFQSSFYFLDIFSCREIFRYDTTLEHHIANSLVIINMFLTDRMLAM